MSKMSTDPASMIQEMDMAGIEKVVLLAFNAKRTLQVHVTNEYVSELVARYPNRFAGFASYDAHDGLIQKELKQERERLGLVGYKLACGYLGLSPDDAGWDAVYLDAVENRLPVLLHMGYSPVKKVALRYCAPQLLEKVLAKYPDLILVIAHMAWPWVDETISLMNKYENVYADMSIVSYYQPIQTVIDILQKAKKAKVAHKLIFGTDYPMCSFQEGAGRIREIRQQMNQSTNALTFHEWEMIFHGNARQVLRDTIPKKRM
ncbi:amidohydrolase family protein [Paenibacillus sp.]|jgi:predicted TIM-barrel fold metal-dependent hydrolase|uniref:amidohydrolase family protein n=1 Tax=Paenibacillus sp. TaxID=58172 RepID=UPI0028381BDB|nr:amidohydrolase family protein [Paenibacillus sp.]MDR0267462.1 amidohydrolase family protein [Paenibacillus sp.]